MFPKWMYHGTLGPQLFETPADLQQAGANWHESPADCGLVVAPAATEGPMVLTPQGAPDAPPYEAATSQDAVEAGRKAKPTLPKTPAQQRAAVTKPRPN